MTNEVIHNGSVLRVVEKGCGSAIEIRFLTMIEANKEKPFDWYQRLDLDKGYASKIRRGLIIPPEWLRIKIAKKWGVDSASIWKAPEIVSADKFEVEE